jgi:signal transduction histidine kinase
MVALNPPLLAALQRVTDGRAASDWRRCEARVRDDERRRLGADLHDNLGQHLTGIACLAAALREELERAGSPLAAQADRIAGCVTTAHEAARALARGLCPPPAPQGLGAALEDLSASVRRLHPVRCTFEQAGPAGGEAPDTAVQVTGIAQEAITNAIRHGGAGTIALRLDSIGGHRRLVIDDDGTGFDPSVSAASGGLGRRLMQDRAARIGGHLRIRPLARGMRVECLFPSESATHAHAHAVEA